MFGFVRFCVFVCCILKTALIIIILFVLLWKTVWDASLMRLFWVLFEFHDCACVVWFHCCFVVVRLAKKKETKTFIYCFSPLLFVCISFFCGVCVYIYALFYVLFMLLYAYCLFIYFCLFFCFVCVSLLITTPFVCFLLFAAAATRLLCALRPQPH